MTSPPWPRDPMASKKSAAACQNQAPVDTFRVTELRAASQEPPTVAATEPLERLLTAREAAAYVNIALQTFYWLRQKGDAYPPAIKVGGQLRYRKSQLDSWLDSQTETLAATK
jgi:excisionase family DNA binding protein